MKIKVSLMQELGVDKKTMPAIICNFLQKSRAYFLSAQWLPQKPKLKEENIKMIFNEM